MTDARAEVQKLLRQQAAIASFGSFALRERDLMNILTEAARVCAEGLSVPFSKVCRYRPEENDLLIVAGYGWHDGVIGHVVSRADESSPQGRAFITGQPSIIGHLQNAAGFDPPPFYAAHGIVSIIDVVIKGSDSQPYGILEIDNDQQHDYDQYDINFLTGFANVLAEAVSTASRGLALQGTIDLMNILTEAARVCAEGLKVPFSKVCRYRPEENDLLIVAGYGWQDGVIGHVVSRADKSSPQGRAFITGQPSIINHLQNAVGFDPPPFYAAHGIVSIIDVVIKGNDNQPYGILEIDNDQQHDYDQYDINFLTGFANVLAEAVSTASRGAALQITIDLMKALVEDKDRLLDEKRNAELQLRQAQKMEAVGQLTGGIAHDLNNILTVITGTIEILADAVAAEPELVTIARMIEEAAERAGDLTQRLLAFARKQPLQPREVDVNSLVVESAKLLRSTLGERIEVSMKLACDTSPALIDPGQLNNAILNLALNARDAMPNGGRLILEAGNVMLDEGYVSINSDAVAGNYVMVAVADSGHGIPADILEHVFEPFFTTKEVDKGSGLGLSMVYGFVKQSNGHIKIYSEAGHGTTVRMYLPQASGAVRSDEPANSARMVGGHETILVVEDDSLVRTFVVSQIQSLGYTTLAAVNAAEALIVIDGPQPIDLLFTDMIMPGSMNGRQLADAALQRRAELKTLFTSGYSNEIIIRNGHLDVGVMLLAKPYRKSDLARMLRAALAA